MKKMKQKFEKMFSHWEIFFPKDDYKYKQNGCLTKGGWLIQYCFGKENNMKYMDIYAVHRMTDPRHTRIYENGKTKELFHYKTGYTIDKDPNITEKNKQKYEKYNRKIAQKLIEKGFNRFIVNGTHFVALTKDSEKLMPSTFGSKIFLFYTHVAGTTHIKGVEKLVPRLKIGAELNLFREPENGYDLNAIVIKTKSGVKIGYIPETDNKIAARLMDAGKLLFAEIYAKEKVDTWHKIVIKVFLRD